MAADRQRCSCHDEPMTWEPDARRKAGGTWRCLARKRERQRVRNEKTRSRALRYYHAANGGYITRRRRELGGQRQEILERLAQLEREAAACR